MQYACQATELIPKKACGATPKLTEAHLDEIIEWISSSERTRRLPYHKVIEELDLDVAPITLVHALKKRGYHRCKALRKPYLSPENRRQQLIWGLEHHGSHQAPDTKGRRRI